jgi:hypothetical protein
MPRRRLLKIIYQHVVHNKEKKEYVKLEYRTRNVECRRERKKKNVPPPPQAFICPKGSFLRHSEFLVHYSIFPPKAVLFSSEVFEKSVGANCEHSALRADPMHGRYIPKTLFRYISKTGPIRLKVHSKSISDFDARADTPRQLLETFKEPPRSSPPSQEGNIIGISTQYSYHY